MGKTQKQGRLIYTAAAICLLVLSSFAWALPEAASSGFARAGEARNYPSAQSAPATSDSESRPLVEIRQAAITKVEKFISRSKKIHIRFEFKVSGKTYKGIFFEGDWNSDHLAALRYGKATLIGYWDTYMGSPSFVAKAARR